MQNDEDKRASVLSLLVGAGMQCRPACITCVWAGVSSAREQKIRSEGMLERATESHTSDACFVRCVYPRIRYYLSEERCM